MKIKASNANQPSWKPVNVKSNIPQELSKLEELAHNMWWAWNYEARNMFKSLDEDLYEEVGHNPVLLLERLSYNRKEAIVKEADGMKGDVKNIRNKEDLEAATQVMLSGRHGQRLYDAIVSYRQRILSMITDSAQAATIKSNLSTDVPKKEALLGRNWQQAMFESMPVAAATTLLTKLQSDVRHAEGEVLHSLIKGIDVKDVRVNALNAYVIPNSQTIVQGSRFEARIIMAAVDTTQEPRIFIGNRQVGLRNGLYEVNCGKTGDFTLAGHIEMTDASGAIVSRKFEQKYTVIAPSATVSADLMNVLYAGYNNPISVSVPGIPSNRIVATMTGGTLQPVGPGKYIARPTKVGADATITISSPSQSGGMQRMGAFTFRVRRLPDPTAFIAYTDDKGNPTKYLGGRGFSKSTLLSVDGIGAAIDDGLLNIKFHVTSFQTVFFDNMGNAIPEVSNSDKFTARQRQIFRSLRGGRRFYINHVTATGPDGTTRTLPQSLEVIVR